ncbi:acidic leucine-rich nuclear phosphoprotein 32-related protein-like isoform X2 [Hibiscus syriacus]|uniref:acidic leucine-rich nuclear phosphoprotein 32-related protein-like isoform X2 n=1 Tax=Hibiscus syriacus TaxID=106335 RepID=UPI00192404F2|nr:acidic leucine-rich nuclear phosphoprotein 32-related protein-like isoform X2 [Hibiscus syriacus]
MDEIWERAVETALDGQADHATARILTLDGVVKCVQGRLPLPSLLEKFENLQHLSIANIGVSSLEQFPRLRNLQKLILSDNRIAGGLKFLVEAGLDSLRELDLSNNRIQSIENLAPLAQLKLVSLDLYECPVTRVKDYRSRVFGLIKSLKYLDKMDAEENERPESDDEEEDEDDPGSGEVDGDDQHYRKSNGHREGAEGIVDEDEDEESDADEEETEIGGRVNGLSHEGNEFRIEEVGRAEDDDGDDDYENGSGEEVDDDEEEGDDVLEVQDIGDNDEEEEEEDDDEEVDNDEGDFAEPESTGRLTSTEVEIDGHEHGEDGDDDENGETGEEEIGFGDDVEYEDEEEGEEDDDYGEGYLVQPVAQAEVHVAEGSEMEPGNEEEEDNEDEEVEDDEDVQVLPSTSSQLKRKRGDDEEEEEEDVEFPNAKESKKHG